jgi:large subunit ribosomal protein L25
MREVQFHPIREQILHIDFYRVVDGKPVAIALPVRLTGTAEGVKIGGKLALSARKLVVSGLIENLPDELVVDVTPLKVGQTIFVGDLSFEGIQFLSPATQAVCAVRVTRASRGAQANA